LPNGASVNIKFYDNTYTYIEENKNGEKETRIGFFECFDSNNNPNNSKKYHKVVLSYLDYRNNNETLTFERKNVFCITGKYYSRSDKEQEVNYICKFAIFLQVLYILIEIISVIILIFINKKEKEHPFEELTSE